MIGETVWFGMAFALFVIGLYCVSKPNMIRIFLGVEMILNSGNFMFIYFAQANASVGYIDPLGQSIVLVQLFYILELVLQLIDQMELLLLLLII